MNSVTREIAIASIGAMDEMTSQYYVEQQRELARSLELQQANFGSLVEANEDARDNFQIVRSFVDTLPAVESHPMRDGLTHELESYIHARSEIGAQLVLGSVLWHRYHENEFLRVVQPYYVIGRQAVGALLLSPRDTTGQPDTAPDEGTLIRVGHSRKLDARLRSHDKSRRTELTDEESENLFDADASAYLMHPRGNNRSIGTLGDRSLKLQPGSHNRLTSLELQKYDVIHHLGMLAQMNGNLSELQSIIKGEPEPADEPAAPTVSQVLKDSLGQLRQALRQRRR